MSFPYYTATSPAYEPQMQNIASITNSYPAVVTTTNDHGYLNGAIVRLSVPYDYGMTQINQQYGSISILSSTSFSIDIDSTFYWPWVVPTSPKQAPQTMPIGEIAETLASSNFNTQSLTNNYFFS